MKNLNRNVLLTAKKEVKTFHNKTILMMFGKWAGGGETR